MQATYEGLTISRPGHSTVRIETDAGTVIYIDPWHTVLDTDPHDGDVVLVSHDDRDHYDPMGIRAVAGPDTTVVAYAAIDTGELSMPVVSIDEGETTTIDGMEVTAVPAYNEPDGPHVRPSGDPYHPRDTVIGFVIRIDGVRVYYPSDTDALSELYEIAADVVLPPIGGRPTMDRHEAAALVRAIHPDLVLPVHYDSEYIDDIDTDAEAFKAELEADGIDIKLI